MEDNSPLDNSTKKVIEDSAQVLEINKEPFQLNIQRTYLQDSEKQQTGFFF